MSTNFEWPKYGNKFIVSCTFYFIGWGLNALNENAIMAEQMEISSTSKEYLILQAGGLIALCKARHTSLPYFGGKLSCVCLMFAYKKKSNDLK